jgi:hypothetical protein
MTRMSALVLAAGLAAASAAGAGDRPVVVELFTSQGCSSCPPAEAVLVDLARRPDVLALGFHVDYWDRLGWKDPFSSAAATARQHRYASTLGSNQVYTPQMVVDGRRDVVGSDRSAVLAAIKEAAPSAPSIPLRLARKGDTLTITVGPGTGAATAWLIGYDPRQETAVRRGENSGRTILQANVVRSVQPVAEWRGQEATLSRPVPAGETAAVILQAADGRILGAALLGAARSRPSSRVAMQSGRDHAMVSHGNENDVRGARIRAETGAAWPRLEGRGANCQRSAEASRGVGQPPPGLGRHLRRRR